MHYCKECGRYHQDESCSSTAMDERGGLTKPEPCPYCGGTGCYRSPMPYEDEPSPCQACGGSGVAQ